MRRNIDQKHSIIETAHLYNVILDTREIFIHGECEHNEEINQKISNKFLKNISLLQSLNTDPITIHQCNIGGDWNAGMMMYDVIRNSICHIIFIMHGISASMGSIIPQAADTRIIMPNCSFMIHNGYTQIDGTYKQLQSFAETDRRACQKMLDIYCEVAVNGQFFVEKKYDDKKIRKFISQKIDQKEDWWLTSSESVFYGFADAVLGDKKYETIENIRNNILK
jgi:ATP-dependent protease ClpP protease subunit